MLRNFFYLIMEIILGGFIMEKQDIINYVLNTPENTNPVILNGMLSQLEAGGGGGGGDSDITTAEVTIKNELTGSENVPILITWLDPGLVEPLPIPAIARPVIFVPIGEEKIITVVLYKGAAYCKIDNQSVQVNVAVETTGDINYNTQFNDGTISGNCTITIGDGPSA